MSHIMGRWWQSKTMQHQTVCPGKHNSDVWLIEGDLYSWRAALGAEGPRRKLGQSVFLLWDQTGLYGWNVCDNTFGVLLEC